MTQPEIFIERLQTYTPEDAADLGILRNHMNPDRSARPVLESRIREFTDAPEKGAFFVARLAGVGRIVSCETLTLIPLPENEDSDPGAVAWLGFVSTRQDLRGRGIIKKVSLSGAEWCEQKGVKKIKFTSNPENPVREEARAFYLKYGAKIVAKATGDEDSTDMFIWDVAIAKAELTAAVAKLGH